jgi:hypothetical protein
MAETHVIGALRHKRAELAGMLRQLEQQLTQQRANLAHVDATMQLFDPDIRPKDIRPKQPRARNAWFRQGECLRLIYDELRDATQPMTTRDLAERIMRLKAIPSADNQCRERVQKTLMWTARRRQALFPYFAEVPHSGGPLKLGQLFGRRGSASRSAIDERHQSRPKPFGTWTA